MFILSFSRRFHFKKFLIKISWLFNKTIFGIRFALIRSREKVLIKLSIKPNHEQSWDGKPRVLLGQPGCRRGIKGTGLPWLANSAIRFYFNIITWDVLMRPLNLKILIVDDEETVRNFVVSLLSKHGHECDTVKDGIEALEKIKKNSFDAAIIDVVLPLMNGIDLTKELLRFNPNLPIMI